MAKQVVKKLGAVNVSHSPGKKYGSGVTTDI
jgi:hypothetical protein